MLLYSDVTNICNINCLSAERQADLILMYISKFLDFYMFRGITDASCYKQY